LVNLDYVEKIEVLGVEKQEDDEPDYCLIAYFTDKGYTTWLTSGTEEQCLRMLDAIASKLHMVKV
jgi:hypothetical protein